MKIPESEIDWGLVAALLLFVVAGFLYVWSKGLL